MASPMGSAVTLQTIADELGISRTTVSNAFSRPDQLSDDLRQRILEVADRLGYCGPHPAARALRSGKAGILGVLLTESLVYGFEDPYAMAFLRGLAVEAEPAGLALLLVPCCPGAHQEEGVRQAVVDSLIAFALPDNHAVEKAIIRRDLPTVFVDGPCLDEYPFVGIDDHQAMGDVARHLIELGHRRIGILAYRLALDDRVGPIDPERLQAAKYRSSRERLRGALDVLAESNIDPVFLYEVGINTRENTLGQALELLSAHERPTAVICLSDQIALGLLDAAGVLGIRVPEDLSVTGFDDIEEAAPAGLTTVRQNASDKSRAAWELLHSGYNEHVLLPYQLIERSTTGPFTG
jgi:DNA-binding LacI/PurR family transcriptional regulator